MGKTIDYEEVKYLEVLLGHLAQPTQQVLVAELLQGSGADQGFVPGQYEFLMRLTPTVML